MSYHSTSNSQKNGNGNAMSPSCQAALAAAAMFANNNNNSNNKNSVISNPNNYNYYKIKQKSRLYQQKINNTINNTNNNTNGNRNIPPTYSYQTRRKKESPYLNPHNYSSQPSVLSNEKYKLDSPIYTSPVTMRHYNDYSDSKLLVSPNHTNINQIPSSTNLNSPSNSSTVSVQSPQSTQLNTWNEMNQNYSPTALAAAASIAKNNPKSLISSTTSPKLIRKKNLENNKQSITKSTLRKSSDNSSIINSISNPLSSLLRTDDANSNGFDNIDDSKSNKLRRKPPPPPRNLTTDNSNLPKSSFENDMQRSSFEFPVQENNYLTQSNISIPYPHSKNSSPTSSPQSNQYSFYNSRDQSYSNNPEMHKRTISKSKKLSNFFSSNPINDETKNQRLYNLQASNSISMLPSDMQQLNLNDSPSFNNDITNQSFTAPPTQSDYFNQQSQNEFYNNSNSSINRNIFENSNNSSSNLYPTSPPVSTSTSHQLVFKTTLRNNDKRGGFGRNRKNKAEFNEDKPWKNHELGNLNIVSSEERKRYEGVFAANKGLYLNLDLRLIDESNKSSIKSFKVVKTLSGNSTNSNNEKSLSDFVNTYSKLNDRIHGLVVREIWIRSKLDHETLKRMWSLVLDDRKRRWLKQISNGNNEWLPDEYMNFTQNLDENDNLNNSADITTNDDMTVNDDTIKDRNEKMNKDVIVHNNDYTDNENNKNTEDIFYDTNEYNNRDTEINENDGNNKKFQNVNDFIDKKAINNNDSSSTLGNTMLNSNSEVIKTPQLQEQPQLQQQNEPSTRKLDPNEIFDLLNIDRNLFDDGTLTCDEFIVGMWLVDQCLYGRKIPKIVPLTVWETIGVDWTVSSSIYGNGYPHHHPYVPVISGVSDIVGMGIKKGKKASSRNVFKKVIGM